ncbi:MULTISPECIES: DUF167 domain-containing protein [Dehalococcoides]|jgi:hypothetical protein|uniref:UPF0235 protein cbdbA1230 n=3 Tax=Dehalococcoides mccartyi TaxID=61435 RepID=Y1230_DEHMC|nr:MULTISPECIES: DUF167 domain-containing protein [Dehalococcoides]A5FQ39.1 RecName: Full=UPF0235 protein DehaBAV1_1103 [Dehalococcoides mccartyi BAV1]Q3ZYH5.1 RecName: Full=UPF0235 protein cbdbA1230 [Dehalococcoides mccartyi CBDB1]AGG06751.1 hypothetical protein dcmb_1151 [Dehalococcoides mccartyi DCMB5]AGG08246.1 hypothetical protein btf_1170 [Dehalococcoides mccartyi BTF08]AII61250.1 hypothetical protein X794_05430 [Dehalococcoides mccartyi CG5]AMU86945.1 hypothetical protein Dm11a5_1119 [
MPPKESPFKVNLKIIPSARKNELAGYENGLLKLKIAAQPEKGKANKELIDYLSDLLDTPKAEIEICHGHTGRNKVLAFFTLSQADFEAKISAALHGS